MDITQCLTVFMIVATNLGTVLTLYFQSDKRLDINRQETNAMSDLIRQDIRSMGEGIRKEMQDFHGRLCAIEERNRK